MEAVGAHDYVKGGIGQRKIGDISFDPFCSPFSVFRSGSPQHVAAEVHTRNVEFRPPKKKTLLQFASTTGHIQDRLVPVEMDGFRHQSHRGIDVEFPPAVILIGKEVVFMAGWMSLFRQNELPSFPRQISGRRCNLTSPSGHLPLLRSLLSPVLYRFLCPKLFGLGLVPQHLNLDPAAVRLAYVDVHAGKRLDDLIRLYLVAESVD